MTPREILALCREKDVRAVDLRFVDLQGNWQGLTLPVGRLDLELFEDGLLFDGSAVRDWQDLAADDLLLVPQPERVFVDPFSEAATLVLIGNIQDPITREDFRFDPRGIAQKALHYLRNTGIADSALFGSDMEFFALEPASSADRATPGEPAHDVGTASSLGHYLAVPPYDVVRNLRNTAMQLMLECDIAVERHHHATAVNQSEIQLGNSELVVAADQVVITKYIVRNEAQRRGHRATFAAKPFRHEKGSSLSTRVSLWKDGAPLFAGTGYAGLSDLAMHALGGLVRHAPSILAFSNPTTGSYERLTQDMETPVRRSYSHSLRSAACRVPVVGPRPESKRIEFRCPDPSCNPYLAFAVILMAMIDGIQNKVGPGKPMEDTTDENNDGADGLPHSLDDALSVLNQNHEFLLRGDVFSPEFIQTWIRNRGGECET